tara:strand:- start:322 stop:1227 length:906 start_codon:yes stop_codon:yes gene_type:complete
MNQPLVSIVVLNCNRLEDLKETIKRTEDINYPNLEIIIVDNGSTDGSAEFIKSYHKDSIRKIFLNTNTGSAFGHNRGMEAAEGKFVVTIDDDCYLPPDSIKKFVSIFEKNRKLAAIGCGFINPYINFNERLYWAPIEINETELDLENSYETFVYTSAGAWRKSALEKVGYIDENWFYVTEDVELCFSLIAHGYNTVVVKELLSFHKSSPLNRDFNQIDYNGICGNVMLILKYYPYYMIPIKLFNIFRFSIYFAIINKKLLYLKAIFGATKKSVVLLKNKTRLNRNLSRKVNLTPIMELFQR